MDAPGTPSRRSPRGAGCAIRDATERVEGGLRSKGHKVVCRSLQPMRAHPFHERTRIHTGRRARARAVAVPRFARSWAAQAARCGRRVCVGDIQGARPAPQRAPRPHRPEPSRPNLRPEIARATFAWLHPSDPSTAGMLGSVASAEGSNRARWVRLSGARRCSGAICRRRRGGG